MATTRFKGETAGERLDLSGISDNDMIQLRHQPGTIEDTDKGISKSQLLSCPFGVSDTAASTGAKVASLTDSNPDFTLVSGREVVVCFTTANSASNPTLNFAGSGAIPIYYPNGQTVGAWPAETWMHLKYFYATVGNSTIQRWILLSDLPVDTVASGNMQSVTSNAVAKAINYPETEVATGAKWIDGKTIYRKVLDFGALPIANTKTVLHYIANISTVISIRGTTTNGTLIFPIPFVNPSSVNYMIGIYLTNTHIVIVNTVDRSDCTDTKIIIEYTKTS